MESPSIRDSSHPRQQIGQAISRQDYPPVSNPARVNNVASRKHRRRRHSLAVLIPIPWRTDQSTVEVSDLSGNLVALLCPRLKVSVRKFGELPPLKLLAGYPVNKQEKHSGQLTMNRSKQGRYG